MWNDSAASRAPFRAAFEPSSSSRQPRGITTEHNAWYDLMWAAQKPLGPGTDGPAYAPSRTRSASSASSRARTTSSRTTRRRSRPRRAPAARANRSPATPFDGRGSLRRDVSVVGRPIRCARACTADPTLVQKPAGYLLPYWMARYYGFLGPGD